MGQSRAGNDILFRQTHSGFDKRKQPRQTLTNSDDYTWCEMRGKRFLESLAVWAPADAKAFDACCSVLGLPAVLTAAKILGQKAENELSYIPQL